MRMGQGVRTGLGHGGITCVLQTQFSGFIFASCSNEGHLVKESCCCCCIVVLRPR